MPELPEVEAVKIQLTKFLLGHTIQAIKINYQKIFVGNPKEIVGAKIVRVRRFAKVLALDLSNDFSIVIQIKMTGQLIYRGPNLKKPALLSKKVVGGLEGKHTHVIFTLNNQGMLYYNDVRKFGKIRIVKTDEVETSGLIGKLGPEPFDGLTAKKFREITSKSKKAIKVLLMDQTKIGGVGNIYANDALWLSEIYPGKSASSLSESEVKKLYQAILSVLSEGIRRGGASENAFVTPDGTEGAYQQHFLVYGKANELCKRCKIAKIKKVALGGRGTYFCPHCQKG